MSETTIARTKHGSFDQLQQIPINKWVKRNQSHQFAPSENRGSEIRPRYISRLPKVGLSQKTSQNWVSHYLCSARVKETNEWQSWRRLAQNSKSRPNIYCLFFHWDTRAAKLSLGVSHCGVLGVWGSPRGFVFSCWILKSTPNCLLHQMAHTPNLHIRWGKTQK